MSRAVQQGGRSFEPWRSGEEDDICPVCKSSRYLNPNMRFLVNPECYHRMCESCVDRIYSHGPAPCPVAGCHRTLRKQRFRKQTFQDIRVEKEVDIRKRVTKIFNRREEEFDTLRDYNDYLEEVETITFNLLNGVDVAQTEARLARYAADNADVITVNKALDEQESATAEAREAAEKERARLRRDAARREAEEEAEEREEGKREIISRLATDQTGNAEKIAREGQKVLLKRSTARRVALQGPAHPGQPAQHASSLAGISSTLPNGSAGLPLVFKGLKPRTKAGAGSSSPPKPYDPFGDTTISHRYFSLQDHYDHPWLERARTDPAVRAGGYTVTEYCTRSLVEAFSGLGVFIADEMEKKEEDTASGAGSSKAAVGDAGVGGGGSTVDVAVAAAANAARPDTAVGSTDPFS